MAAADHPVVVAAVAVSATIGIAVLLVKEIILPTYVAAITHESNLITKELGDKIETLTKEIAALDSERNKLTKQVEELKARNETLSKAVFEAQHANSFFKGSPYPLGLEKIKVGDKVELVEGAFPADAVRKQKREFVVENQHAIFSRVYYSFNPEAKVPIVNSIRFETDWLSRRLRKMTEIPRGWVGDSLKRSLGPPLRMFGDDRDCMFWRIDERVFVYHKPARIDLFWVMDDTSYPASCHPTLTEPRN